MTAFLGEPLKLMGLRLYFILEKLNSSYLEWTFITGTLGNVAMTELIQYFCHPLLISVFFLRSCHYHIKHMEISQIYSIILIPKHQKLCSVFVYCLSLLLVAGLKCHD